MDERQPYTLTDAEIDREIQAALSVDPPPEFLARLRTRIANNPVAPGFRWSWVSAGVFAALLLVAAMLSVSRHEEVTPDLKVGTTEIGTIAPTRTADPKIGLAEMSRAKLKVSTTDAATTASAIVPTVRAARVKQSPVPEVLISPDTIVAFQQLVTSTREGRFQISFDEPLPVASTPLTELNISPITIAPLEPTASDEGVLQ